MHVEDTQAVCPFRLVRARPKDYMAPLTSKASPAAKRAISVARVAAGKPSWLNFCGGSLEDWKQDICGSTPEVPSVTLYKLLDKLDKHCLDFATMLKFFEFFGWFSDNRRNKHDAWVEDWHDVLKFLGGLPERTSSLRIDHFMQLVKHPDRPPLLQNYTVDQMLYHVRQSYLAHPIMMPPPMSKVPVEEARGFADWYVKNNHTRPLVWHLCGFLERHPEAKSILEPDGVFFMYWYYSIFGDIVNQYFENWQDPGPKALALVPVASSSELRPGTMVPSSVATRAYEQFRVCWMWFQGEKYLFLNLWDMDKDFFTNVKWWVQEPHRLANNGALAVVWDASTVPGLPDCLCMAECEGLKSMVQASNKQKRARGIWAAIYLHYLLKHPRPDRMEGLTCFDGNVFDWVDLMKLSAATVDFDSNTFEGPVVFLTDL